MTAIVDRAAQVIGAVMSRWDIDGRPDVPGGIDVLLAQALADAGLLAPGPFRAEYGREQWIGHHEVRRERRFVSDWEWVTRPAIDHLHRAEGDGRAVSHE